MVQCTDMHETSCEDNKVYRKLIYVVNTDLNLYMDMDIDGYAESECSDYYEWILKYVWCDGQKRGYGRSVNICEFFRFCSLSGLHGFRSQLLFYIIT